MPLTVAEKSKAFPATTWALGNVRGQVRAAFDFFFQTGDHARAIHPGPGAQAPVSGLNVAARDEAVHRRVNPAIQRDVGAGQVFWIRCGLHYRIVEMGIVARVVDVASNFIPDQAPTKTSDRKCLPAAALARLTPVAKP